MTVRPPDARLRRPRRAGLRGLDTALGPRARTRRLRPGVMVTSGRFRPPAPLAGIATTAGIVFGGRLDSGIGVGPRPDPPQARRGYPAHGLPFLDPRAGRGEPRRGPHGDPAAVDRDGTVRLPRRPPPSRRSVRQPRTRPAPPPAEHADPWGIPGGDIDDAVRRGAPPGRRCAGTGRGPASVTRSVHLPVPCDRPAPRGRRSARRSTPASGTSSSGCRRPTPPTSRGGSSANSSARRQADLRTGIDVPLGQTLASGHP
ncbi:hypothetical protein SUDANB15_04373 [Streptomyces sp. enrichment culture]